MSGDSLLPVVIHTSPNQPNLFMGGDREIMMVLMLMEFVLVFQMLSVQSFLTAVVLWILLVPLIRYMARKDPLLRKIFLAQLKYQKFYPAHSTPFAELS